ncbi:TetR/AcrR family transcriptional regulator [Pseudomonas corrugata]|uniref:TetR/AcrR family transcriptional regulator n=1 Tax=Pseudomonas corrugata TaxID=47879 RepID=UPI0015861D9F|nr:TetR/AcrR family transcriptional regulator [Pseudomonas corrugata]MCI0995639.1 TetR/AcrR family transcriptional regulator [Pseudomonas corrugata]NUT64690.1 TetR/AcrR family transcriptional regulator [Pseudomonas corrugata]
MTDRATAIHGVGRPRKEEVSQRLQHLREMAMRHFIEHGYDGASLEQIALAAGISKVTIYRHFVDKADLFRSVVLEASTELLPELGDVLDESRSIEDALADFALCHINLIHGQGATTSTARELARLLIAEAGRLPDSVQACRSIFFEQSCVPLSNYFKLLNRQGRLSVDDPEFAAAYFIQGTFFVVADLLGNGATGTQAASRSARSRQCARMFLQGCLPRANVSVSGDI